MKDSTCKHCGRRIVLDATDGWVDPEATGDDAMWRETCDAHDTFTAEHEPASARVTRAQAIAADPFNVTGIQDESLGGAK